MDTSANLFLTREIEKVTKAIQKSMFSMIDEIRAADSDNVIALKTILQDDELAARFQLFQENKNKLIRKKILDATCDLQRDLLSHLEDYDVNFRPNTQFTGIIKENI